jgi:dihydroflavonol-4-reductase
MSGDIVLVTGATGFVGSAVARKAAAHGLRLRVLARAGSKRDNLAGLNCEIAEGDMRDAGAMQDAMRGVRYLFHVAADYRLWARDSREILRNNLTGTAATMEAALQNGVERIVYTSSVATLKPGSEHAPGAETNRLDEKDAVGAYKRSKIAAERAVEALIAERGLAAVIVHPSTPIGPGDIKPTPTGRIVVEAASGRMPAYIETGLNLVHVDDVAEGHWLALEKGAPGSHYILGGENVSLRDMLNAIDDESGRKQSRLRLARAPLYPLAYAAEAAAMVTGKEPFLTVDGLTMAKQTMFYSSAKAARDWGYRARPYREGIRDALSWFRKVGYCP